MLVGNGWIELGGGMCTEVSPEKVVLKMVTVCPAPLNKCQYMGV